MSTRASAWMGLWGALAIAALSTHTPVASAQSNSGLRCVVRGATPMPVNLPIYDKSDGGRPIARFTGAHTALAAVAFPESSARRIEIETGTGSGGFRIDGFIAPNRLPIYTAQKVTVSSAHVWIAAQQEVGFVGASSSGLRVKKSLNPPLEGSVTGTAQCGALTLTPGTPSGWTPSGDARGYQVTQDSIDLYSAPDGGSVATLRRSSSSPAILLFSTERQGNWVKVEYHGEIVVDAWARSSDLRQLPPGETMDQLAAPSYQRGAPKFAISNSAHLVRTTKEIPLRLAARDSEPVIGRIEADTDTYVLDIVAGWASVLPKSLNVQPYGEDQFWVPAKELPP